MSVQINILVLMNILDDGPVFFECDHHEQFCLMLSGSYYMFHTQIKEIESIVFTVLLYKYIDRKQIILAEMVIV